MPRRMMYICFSFLTIFQRSSISLDPWLFTRDYINKPHGLGTNRLTHRGMWWSEESPSLDDSYEFLLLFFRTCLWNWSLWDLGNFNYEDYEYKCKRFDEKGISSEGNSIRPNLEVLSISILLYNLVCEAWCRRVLNHEIFVPNKNFPC